MSHIKKDSKDYTDKKKFFDSIITLYGRNVVEEILQDEMLEIHKLHVASSNKIEGTMKSIMALAQKRGIKIVEHDKASLSRISKNAKQDQGVAVDIISPNYKSAEELKNLPSSYRLLALDGVQNPQNLGMIIRSAAAGKIDGIILSKKKSAKISPLVMKASAGTMFKIDLYYCSSLEDTLKSLINEATIYSLTSYAERSLFDMQVDKKSIFVLGNESEGVSEEISSLATQSVKIPMNRGVESLNVATTATLIAFF